MKDFLVRICSIELKGFKNTEYGLLEMPSVVNGGFFSRKSDILGIYGQNGSGKTAVIEAMAIIQKLLMGNSLPEETVQYISKEMNRCSILVAFAISVHGDQSKVEYSVALNRIEDNKFEIAQETLSSAVWRDGKFEKKKPLLHFELNDSQVKFTPNYRYHSIVNHEEENRINFGVAYKLAQKEHKSFIFSEESRSVLLSAPEEASAEYAYIIRSLNRYASLNLFVISSAHAGSISMDYLLPFAFCMDTGDTIVKGSLPVRLDEPSLMSQKHFDMVRQMIDEMNVVLQTLIPGLFIGVHDFGEQLLENGETGHRIQLISRRGEVVIPLKYESEGIVKIISILNALMCVYNDPSMCLIIDELDSGIYEYLLGELISVFDKSAKGQLIFTSHNLRALEMLHKSSVIFSTTNPKKRYMRLQNAKTNKNLRDSYLRCITLGGQKEEVYAETDTVEIGRAFRRVGKVVRDGRED